MLMENSTPAANPLSLKANTHVANWVRRSFWLLNSCFVIGVFVYLAEIDMIERLIIGKGISAGEIAENEKRKIIFISGILFSSIISTILFLVWFYKVYCNMRLAGFHLRYRPSMAVWGFFIPIASFVIPYLIAKEIAAKTATRIAEQAPQYRPRATKFVVLIWWILYWLAGAVGTYSSLLGLSAKTPDMLIEAALADICYISVSFVAVIATNNMVKRLADNESEMLEKWKEA